MKLKAAAAMEAAKEDEKPKPTSVFDSSSGVYKYPRSQL